LICVLNDVIAAALYWIFFAYKTFILSCGETGVEPGLMKCMFNMICEPAASGSPTPLGIFISTITPGNDVAYTQVPPPPNWQETSVLSG